MFFKTLILQFMERLFVKPKMYFCGITEKPLLESLFLRLPAVFELQVSSDASTCIYSGVVVNAEDIV